MQTFRYRERVMELLELLTGNRVQYEYASIGGVNRDLGSEVYSQLKSSLKEIRER